MRVAIYARVSTAAGQDPTMQTRELREYCTRRGWDISGAYIDVGISATKERRPELDRLMADAHKRRFDVVCVWKFDRFARSVSHLLKALETFKALGIDFVSYSEAMDTSTPAGKMVFTVLGAVAELERSLIVERVRAGLRNAKAKGKALGRLASLWTLRGSRNFNGTLVAADRARLEGRRRHCLPRPSGTLAAPRGTIHRLRRPCSESKLMLLATVRSQQSVS
jgi:DNA invertase Pin-like site-specific DNA recombinase